MASLSFAVVVLSVVLLVEAGGHGQGQQGGVARGGWQGGQQQQQQPQQGGWQGQQGGSARGRGGWGQGQEEDQGWQGQGQGQGQGRSGASGRQGDSGKYRTNLYDDDDVYGYDASYPNGQALYVNYRNNDARSRRGPEFARSNSISARSSGRSNGMQQEMGRQQRGAMGFMGMDDSMGRQ